ncbi:MAG: hypothetical protein KDA61_15355, partial [Planctomycetales bacterium]|nr:hypothetical protein [Planctomycetales bacterium]
MGGTVETQSSESTTIAVPDATSEGKELKELLPDGVLEKTEVKALERSSSSAAFEYNGAVALEPTTALDQQFRYLQHLAELRRINEGDDTSDSAGYGLRLVRIPVSVFTGQRTRKGYGAEITITAESYLGDALLPTTFRSLIINDVVDQLSLPITRVAEQLPETKKAREERSIALRTYAKRKDDEPRLDRLGEDSYAAAIYPEL